MITLTEEEHRLVTAYMLETCGIDLSTKKYLVESKISVGCFLRHITTFAEFWRRLQGAGEEAQELQQWLVDILTTNYSYFNREEDHFRVLQDLISDGKIPVHRTQLKVWCAGCASGQEAYTLAMLLEDACRNLDMRVPYTIVASDVSRKAVETAKKGKYSLADYVRLPDGWKQRYCHLLQRECEVKLFLRRKVEFRQESLFHARHQGRRYDIIFCRNVMIYFDAQHCRLLLRLFSDLLVPGGYLFLGHTEFFEGGTGFTYVEPAVYKKVEQEDDCFEN